MESWFKVNSRLVVEDPTHWSKSRLGILCELNHEALLVFLFLKVVGNFQTTFRVSWDVLARVAGVTGKDLDVDDILHELETYNLIRMDGQDFTLTDSSAARKVEAAEEANPARTPPKPVTKEEQRAKAFAGLCTQFELDLLGFNDVITIDELRQLEAEHKYVKDDF